MSRHDIPKPTPGHVIQRPVVLGPPARRDPKQRPVMRKQSMQPRVIGQPVPRTGKSTPVKEVR